MLLRAAVVRMAALVALSRRGRMGQRYVCLTTMGNHWDSVCLASGFARRFFVRIILVSYITLARPRAAFTSSAFVTPICANQRAAAGFCLRQQRSHHLPQVVFCRNSSSSSPSVP